MDINEAFSVLDGILEESGTAVLATVGSGGAPRLRWMTPLLIPGRTGFLYAVTSPQFEKKAQLDADPRVEWMVQTRSLTKVMNLQGKIQILESPQVKSEMLEQIGGRLSTFWRVNPEAEDLVVLETVIEEIRYFEPMTGRRETLVLKKEA